MGRERKLVPRKKMEKMLNLWNVLYMLYRERLSMLRGEGRVVSARPQRVGRGYLDREAEHNRLETNRMKGT